MRPIQTNILILLRLIKYIDFVRFLNLLKLNASFVISRINKTPIMFGMPWSISVEPTSACNLSCPECPTGSGSLSRPKGTMDQSLFEKLIIESGKEAFYLNLYFQGEPFLNKNLLQFIKIAKKKRFFISCATNAQIIDKEQAKDIVSSGLDHLVVSFDGTTQDTYEKYRIGGNLESVIEAVMLLVEEKRKQKKLFPLIILQFIVFKHNEHQIAEAKRIAKSLNVDNLVFKTAQLYDLNNSGLYIPDNKRYTRYTKLQNGMLELKKTGNNKCWKSWSSCVITWDGRIVPCCFDKDATHCYGKLSGNSYKEIILGEKSKEFKRKIFRKRKDIDICSNCTEN